MTHEASIHPTLTKRLAPLALALAAGVLGCSAGPAAPAGPAAAGSGPSLARRLDAQATQEAPAGTLASAVIWSVQEAGGGTITTGGLYTAPAATGTFHVVATSVLDPTKSATATITVEEGQGTAPTADSASHLGPLTVATYKTGIPPGAHYVNPMIYYPTGGSPPYPGVVFVPGFCENYFYDTVPPGGFTQWGTFLASHGIAVMFLDTSADGCDGDRSAALADGLTTLAAEASRAGSPLKGLLDPTRLAVMGHSFGGSATLYTASSGANPNLRAAMALCPVITNGHYPSDHLPSLIIAGKGDPVGPDTQAQYDSIPATTPKVLAWFTEVPDFPDSMHNVADTPLGTNPTDPVVARLGLSFLQVYLVGDARYRPFITADPALAAFSWNQP